LTSNINFSSSGCEAYASGDGWLPIGNITSGYEFSGSFLGNNYNITNLFIDRPTTDYLGLFGYIHPSGNIYDTILIDVSVTGNDYLGALVGFGNNILINGSSATGTVVGDDYLGGLAGDLNLSTINNSYAVINITGEKYIGGLAGSLNSSSIIDNSYASGNISCGYNTCGGLVGITYSYSDIYHSFATGDVIGAGYAGYYGNTDNQYLGGLIGRSYTANVTDSNSSGKVINSEYGDGYGIGGLVGATDWSIFINSSASGDVTAGASLRVGGLIGESFNYSIIDSSYATGYVNGSSFVGGLVGYSLINSEINNSYATGNVNCSTNGGGLVGYNQDNSWIANSYSVGNVSGQDSIGGLLGKNIDYSEIISCFTSGNVSGTTNVGGLLGTYEIEPYITDSYWYNQSQGLNCYNGGNVGCTAVIDITYFYDVLNSPMNFWGFETIWDDVYNGINYPVLIWQINRPKLESFYNPVNNGYYSGTIAFNASVFKNNLDVDSVYFNITYANKTQYDFIQASADGDYYNASLSTNLMRDGVYTIKVYANDTSNNLNDLEKINITVDNTNPSGIFSCSPSYVGIGATMTCTCTISDALSGIDSSATNYTLHPSTDSVGSFSQTCMFEDFAGNTESLSASYTVSSSGDSGTGGAGGATTSGSSSTSTFTQTGPESPLVIPVDNPQIAITTITVSTNENVGGGSLTVTEIDIVSQSDLKVGGGGVTYQSFKIDTTGINDTNIANVSIDFKINKSWLVEQNMTPSSVSLFRKSDNGNQWTELPTILNSSDDLFYYFQAFSPGFSSFAVFIDLTPCIVGEVRCYGKELQNCIDEKKWLVLEECDISCENAECKNFHITTSGTRSFYVILTIIGFAVFVIAYSLYRYFSERKAV
jgi:PGF-pre-PGF domain-containing protein